jgi:hypothetical protein
MATSASNQATAVAKTPAQAKSALDVVIAHQQTVLKDLRAAEVAQVGRAAGLRSTLLRQETPRPGQQTDNSHGC